MTFRAWCRDVAAEDEIVQQRLQKELRNGTVHPGLHVVLLAYGFGPPPKKIELEIGERQRPGLLTRRPIGWDPLAPDHPDAVLVEAIYGPGVVIEPLALPAHEEPRGSKKKPAAKSTIVPRPGVVPPVNDAPPAGYKKRVPKRPPDDDGTSPLRVDGI